MIWEEIFSKRKWGKYPPEELVRTATRYSRSQIEKKLSCLEIGPGPGANAQLLTDLFYNYSAIDISKTAITQLNELLKYSERREIDLKVGCCSLLPWEKNKFDFICDNFSIYANRMKTIESCLSEVSRVMNNNSLFYSRVWGTECYGTNTGIEIEYHTYDKLQKGPCAGYGVSHFFDLDEINKLYGKYFIIKNIQKTSKSYPTVSQNSKEGLIEEFIILLEKK